MLMSEFEDEDYVYDEEDYEYRDECEAPELNRESSYPDAFRVPDGSYKVLEYKDMMPLMDALLRDTSSVLGVSADTALILLSHYGWNKEKLLDQYWVDTEACLAAAGLTSSPFSSGSLKESTSPAVCKICYDEIPPEHSFHLDCGHTFCKDCYKQYLTIKVESEGSMCVKTHCPEPKCTERVADSLFKQMLDDSVLEKYRDFSIKNFIESSSFVRYCPAAGCDRVAIGRGVTNIVCLCGNPFCFRCGEEAHDPATCGQLSKWIEKCRDESETANWMIVHTKKCPKCDARTEKNQGCNHMTCIKCKHDYCWICMAAWAEHGSATGGYYKCNKFNEETAEETKGPDRTAKLELERYMHFYTRHHGHHTSMEHARKVQLCGIDGRMRDMQEAEQGSYVDVQFLRQAVLQVIECRRVLKYTYVLGYFLKGSSGQRELFEYHQEMLEKNTDALSELTERSIDAADRTQVVNLTRITEQFLRNLLSEMMDKRSSMAAGEDNARK